MKLSNEQRARAVGMLEAGVNQAVVAWEFGVHRSTISRLQSKFLETTAVADCPRAGRPRVTTLRQDRTIRLMHLRNCLQTAKRTAAEIPGRNRPVVCRDTVLSRLRGFGIRCRRPCVTFRFRVNYFSIELRHNSINKNVDILLYSKNK